jgi:hypothetical protein
MTSVRQARAVMTPSMKSLLASRRGVQSPIIMSAGLPRRLSPLWEVPNLGPFVLSRAAEGRVEKRSVSKACQKH